jgi:hypothetical protein
MATILYKCVRISANIIALCMLLLTVLTIAISEKHKGMFIVEKSLRMLLGTEKLLFYLGLSSFFTGMITSTAANSKSKFTMKLYLCFAVCLLACLAACLVYLHRGWYLDSLKNSLSSASLEATTQISAMIGLAFAESGIQEASVDTVFRHATSVTNFTFYLYTASLLLTLAACVCMGIASNSRLSKSKTAPSEQTSRETIGFSPASLRKDARRMSRQ